MTQASRICPPVSLRDSRPLRPLRVSPDKARHPSLLLLFPLFLIFMGAGCASHGPVSPPHPETPVSGSFFSSFGAPVDETGVAETLRHADYVLIGETHDVLLHHEVQARIMDLLAREGRRPLAGLEMVSTDRQKVLDRFNRKALSVADLPRALDWKQTWGFDFSLYQPVFETARDRGIPVYALNVPRRVFEAARNNRLSPADQRRMPARIIPPQKAQQEFLHKIFSMHRAMGDAVQAAPSAKPGKDTPSPAAISPEPANATRSSSAENPAFTRFIRMQSLWDSAMAEQAAALRKRFRRPVIILAGGGHVEYGYGIAHRLRVLDPQARITLVMPFAGRPVPSAPVDGFWNATVAPAAPPEAASTLVGLYAPPADVLFYSPPRLRSRLGITLAEQEGRVLVTGVEPGSRAARAGIRAGQHIVRLGDVPIHALRDMHRAAAASRGKASASVTVEENGRESILSLHMPQE